MACMLYARMNGTEIRLGRFKDRAAAEEYFRLWLNSMKSCHDKYPLPIYVETGKGRGNR